MWKDLATIDTRLDSRAITFENPTGARGRWTGGRWAEGLASPSNRAWRDGHAGQCGGAGNGATYLDDFSALASRADAQPDPRGFLRRRRGAKLFGPVPGFLRITPRPPT